MDGIAGILRDARLEAGLGLAAMARRTGYSKPYPGRPETNPGAQDSISEDYIVRTRARMRELLAVDARYGGNEASKQALLLFRSVQRTVGVAHCPPSIEREQYSTVGELAEVAGWFFYDADRQDTARRFNQEALYYLRWAGDKSLELLTLQNIAMQAEYLGRPAEALRISRDVLAREKLPPRLRVLFLARSAHALALRQQRGDALRALGEAKSRYLDGPSGDEPAWAYWVDDRQMAWFEAMVWTALHDHGKAADIFHAALESSPQERVRGLYSRSAYLFASFTALRGRRDAEDLLPSLATYVAEVGSGRTASILDRALRQVPVDEVRPSFAEGVSCLRDLLAARA
ncbi:hypothetical protein [Actinokineospora enzanensis]|uniref:hypothetical protein n=1 Tax=Actinokineospora enzanensis TaxID=155975 RepID=UPI00037EB71B|nr:hypothetical protein [Actinokineospora enzanensis]